MPFYAQHQRKCYCNSSTCSCCCSHGGVVGGPAQIPTTIKHTLSSLSKSKKDKNTGEKFVKIRSSSSNANGRGLGHSHNVGGMNGSSNQNNNNNNFSRRNSAATTTSTATRTTINAETMLTTKTATRHSGRGDSRRGSGYSDFYTSAAPSTNSSKYELTASRKYYERCKEVTAAAHSDFINAWTSSGNSGNTPSTTPIVGERMYALQQWRIQNPDDCFSVHRQNDLKMQQRLKEANLPSTSVFGNKFCVSLKPRSNYVVEAESSPSLSPPQSSLKADAVDLKTLTPYAIRQKLLQLRLQAQDIAEHKPRPTGGQKQKWSYGVVDKSCALRYQETY